MKSEPAIFSIDDLQYSKKELWEGVRNYQVRNMFRDLMQKGDKALMYHSSTEIIGVVGEMLINKVAMTDPTQFDKKNLYFDALSKKNEPRWLAPTVKFKRKLENIVSLKEIKLLNSFKNNALIKAGNRLSVIEITKAQYVSILALAR